MPSPVCTTNPLISGNPVVGVDTFANNGQWSNSPTGFTYQWSYGDTAANITGAISSDYTPVMADLGHTLVLTVTATNGSGSTSQASSASAPVQLTPTQAWSMSMLAVDVLAKLVVFPVGQSASPDDLNFVQQAYSSRFQNLRTRGWAPWPINAIPTEAQQAVSKIVAADVAVSYGISGQRLQDIMAIAESQGFEVLQAEYRAFPRRLPPRRNFY